MHALHHTIIAFASAHALLACVVGGLLASVETLPVVGALVPGTATIVAIAALVPSGAIPFAPLVAAVALGAMVGDSVSFAIGRRFGPALLTSWPLNRHPALVAKAQEGVARHGGKTLLVSRFTPGVRAIVPPLAGALGMKTSRFVPIIIAAGLIWAFAHVGLGIAIGAGLELLGAVAGRLALFVLVAGLLIWLSVRLVLALGRRLPPLIARIAGFLLAGLARGDSRFSTRLARVLASPPRTVTALVLMALLLALGAWGFGAALALLHQPVPGGSEALATALSLLRTRWSEPLLLMLAATGNRVLLAAVALSVLAGLARRRRSPLLWVAGLLGAVVLDATMGSAPAALEATLYGMLAYAAVHDLRPPRGRLAAVPVALVIVLAGFARTVLGLSMPAEEVAGVGFALAWVGLAGVADILRHHGDVGDPTVAATPGMASGATASALVALAMVMQLAGLRLVVPPTVADPEGPRVVLALDAWRGDGWATLHGEQTPLLGHGGNKLVLQWAGSTATLANRLAAAGWHRPMPWTPRSAMAWLLPNRDAASLPVLPHFYRGEPDRLALIHAGPTPGERLVLRLWHSHTEVTGPHGPRPVVVGTLSREMLRRVLGMLTLAEARHATAADLAGLARALPVTRWVTAPAPPWVSRAGVASGGVASGGPATAGSATGDLATGHDVLLAWPLPAPK